jgi:hypothetical protein
MQNVCICKLFCAILNSTLHNYSVTSVEITKVLFMLMHTIHVLAPGFTKKINIVM